MKLELFIYALWALGAFGVLNLGYQAIKKRGIKGALFGAQIVRTVGELDLGKSGPMHTILKLHCLHSLAPGAPRIGIELVNKSFLSYHMLPIRLTSEQAAALRDLLYQALSNS